MTIQARRTRVVRSGMTCLLGGQVITDMETRKLESTWNNSISCFVQMPHFVLKTKTTIKTNTICKSLVCIRPKYFLMSICLNKLFKCVYLKQLHCTLYSVQCTLHSVHCSTVQNSCTEQLYHQLNCTTVHNSCTVH